MQQAIVQLATAAVQRQPQAEVHVVVQVGAGGDDPVDEAGPNQGDQDRTAEACRCQGTGERQADPAFRAEHFLGVQPGRLP